MNRLFVFIRASLFNIVFYGLNIIACIACLPFLFAPRPVVMGMIRVYLKSIEFVERSILGLRYEVIGLENLPKTGGYIVAAKHQSPYETFKLHLLFNDPAVVLKRELLRIPIWGKFLRLTNPIAINRKAGKEAMKQVIDRTLTVKDEGRPVIIFPQGTRVYPWQTVEDKPYKFGLIRMYEKTGMPVVPLALNTGMFWPRTGWLKSGGKVTFKFLPPIAPGRDPAEVANEIETILERESLALQDDALDTYKGVKHIYNPPGRIPEE